MLKPGSLQQDGESDGSRFVIRTVIVPDGKFLEIRS